MTRTLRGGVAAGGSDRGRANVPRSTTTPVRKALTSLDHRVELAVGYTVDRLWRDHDRGLLDEQIESVAAAHRSLSSAEQSVTFYRVLLQRLASGEYPMDSALFDRIGRTVKQLQEAVRIRGARETELSDVLEPVEANAARTPAGHTDLKAHDIALLLAIGQGAKLREHLLAPGRELRVGQGGEVEGSGAVGRGRLALGGRQEQEHPPSLSRRPDRWPGH